MIEKATNFDIPAHVPDKLVFPIGLTEGEQFLRNPHEFMASLHETHPPIFFSPSNLTVNAWMLTKYRDVFFALRHSEIFTTRGAVSFPRDPDNYFEFIPLEIDPPLHRKYKSILDPLFNPAAVAELEHYIRGLARKLIDNFVDRGACDFPREFSRPLPVTVFLQLMGLPLDQRDTFVGWAMDLLHGQSRELAARAVADIAAYLTQVIAEKSKSPDEGAISMIVHATPDGEPLTEREKFGFVFFLFIGGLDTVFAALNYSFLWLAQNPQGRRRIREEPDIAGAAIHELLRAFSVTFSGRVLAKDHEMNGVKMKKGDRITSILPAANYDPEIFENPRKVDFDRPRKPNLAFGGGAHNCLGIHLARLEMEIAVEEFLRRIPDFRLPDEFVPEYYPGGVVGPKSLPLSWER